MWYLGCMTDFEFFLLTWIAVITTWNMIDITILKDKIVKLKRSQELVKIYNDAYQGKSNEQN